MTKKYSTKKALIASVLSLALCFSMLVGTTFAWFTDSAVSAGNIIQTGTLDVEMYWADGKEDPDTTSNWADASEGAIFNYDKWEPGYAAVRHIKIANEGTLALKYTVRIVPNGDVSDLADVIDVYYADPAVQIADATALTEANKLGTLTEVLAGLGESGNGELEAGKADTITLALKMQEGAGNEYQNKAIGASFSIQVLATQLASEEDSFGTDYDAGAEYPEVSVDNATHTGEEETKITSAESKIELVIPEGAKEGNYALETSEASITTDSRGNNTVSFDITLKVDGQKVAEVAGVAYTVSVDIGAGLNILSVTHAGVAITDYEYDATTGIITFETAHFSPFSFTYDLGAKAEDADSLAELVAEGGVVQLKGDVALEDAPLVITKDVVLNLNGYTISGKSTSSTTSFFINVKNGAEVMIQNGTVSFYATTPDTNWGGEGQPAFPGYANNTVKADKGTLIVNNAKIENITAAGGASYAIDAYPGANVIINNGSVIDGCGKTAIRMFANSNTEETNVTINGGVVTGSRAVWVQLPGSNLNNVKLANLTVNGGTLESTDPDNSPAIYSYSYGDSFAKTNIVLNGGKFIGNVAFGGGSKASVENVTINWAKCEFNNDVVRYVEDGAVYYVKVTNADELKAAIADGNVAVLVNDVVIANNETITVANGAKATIDLNGYKLSGTADKTGNQELFLVKGALNVYNGKIDFESNNNQGWNAMSTIFDITAGGVVTLDKVVADNKGGTDMNFVAHLNNWGTATLNVTNSTLKATYIAVRAFNSGYDMNNITIENTELAGKYCFWVHNYTSEGKDDSTLNVNIYNKGNTFTYTGNAPVLYGFDNSIYFDENGCQQVTAPITVNPAPYKGECYEEGTIAAAYKNMKLSGDAYILIGSEAVVAVENVTSNVNGSVIVMKDYQPAVYVNGGDFTIDEGEYLIDASAVEGGVYQIFLVNVTVNGEYLTQETAAKYLNNVNWYGAYIFVE